MSSSDDTEESGSSEQYEDAPQNESRDGEMATNTITGPFSCFNEEEEDWESYVERFELFLAANSIKDDKKVSTLLACVGPRIYKLLKTLCSPTSPKAKQYEEITKLVKEHLNPSPYFLTERIKFAKRDQLEGESIAAYVVQLRKLATHCKFGSNLNEQLRDRFVTGIRSHETQRRFRSEKDENLTFTRSIEIATAVEQLELDLSAPQANNSNLSESMHFMKRQVNQRSVEASTGQYNQQHIQTKNKGHNNRHHDNSQRHTNTKGNLRKSAKTGNGRGEGNTLKCRCCGTSNHIAKNCRYRNYNCLECGRKGHLRAVCYKRKTQNNFLGVTSQNCSQELAQGVERCLSLFTCESNREEYRNPFFIRLKIEGESVNVQVDTGAGVSVISEKQYRKTLIIYLYRSVTSF